jgi:hypothetical protein
MKAYNRLLKRLGVPDTVRKLVAGTWKVPAGWQWWPPTEPHPYPFVLPPALVPFNFQIGADLVFGWWRHWFAPDRRPTYVYLGYDGPFHVVERARNPAQLIAVELIRNRDTLNLDPGAHRLLRNVGISAQVFPEDDDYAELSGAHPVFAGDWPHGLVGDALVYDGENGKQPYTGDFPPVGPRAAAVWKRAYTPKMVRQYCGMEVAWTPGLKRAIRKHVPKAPPWLLADADQPAVFAGRLKAGDHAGAWMSLNSSTWQPDAAVDAMTRLADAVTDADFRLFARAWIAENRGKQYGM